MSSAMAAASLLRDLIIDGKSEYETLFSPQRSIFTKQLAINVSAATAGLLSLGRPRCAHMGCKLKWNRIERTWDCSCHGSRFERDGNIINNPTKWKTNT
jgi:hypothetical protein